VPTKLLLAAIDLDGTLLDEEKRISPENLRAVRSYLAAGGRVALATGRMHSALVKYAQELGLAPDAPMISYNGAMIKTLDEKLIEETPVSADLAVELVTFCADRKLHLNYYLDDTLFVSELSHWTELYRSRTGSVAVPVGDLHRFDGQRPTKLLIIDEASACDALQKELTPRYADKLYITKTDNEYLEFMNPDANKGRALATVAQRLNVPREACLAFGDSYNDVPMLEWAGWSVAMSNGKQEAIHAAQEVVDNDRATAVATVLNRSSYE
jgi:Cof subfamily protein (haloacid dehalogenase superfamily)